MKIVNVAKSIILNDKGEILLLKRSQSAKHRPNEWDFPGGWVEEGEAFAIAASRETEEEAGIVIPVSDFRLAYTATSVYEDNDMSVNRLLFVASTHNGDIKLSHEHTEYRWVELATALREFKDPFYNAGLRYVHKHNLL